MTPSKKTSENVLKALSALALRSKMVRSRFWLTGPGRRSVLQQHRRIDRGIARDKARAKRGIAVTPANRHYEAGLYATPEAAQAAIKRLARWMAANPNATSHREVPLHIVRNAARAQRQFR